MPVSVSNLGLLPWRRWKNLAVDKFCPHREKRRPHRRDVDHFGLVGTVIEDGRGSESARELRVALKAHLAVGDTQAKRQYGSGWNTQAVSGTVMEVHVDRSVQRANVFLDVLWDSLEGKNLRKVSVRSCLLYTSPSPRDGLLSRMPSSA